MPRAVNRDHLLRDEPTPRTRVYPQRREMIESAKNPTDAQGELSPAWEPASRWLSSQPAGGIGVTRKSEQTLQ
jgi:hypothetical protein